MGAFQLAIDIRRPPADVFAFIAQPQNMPLWYEAVQQVTKTTANPTGAGSRYDIVRSLPNGPAFNDATLQRGGAIRRRRLGPSLSRPRSEPCPRVSHPQGPV